MKVRVYVSGWITDADGSKKEVVVCSRDDGMRFERVFPMTYNFDLEADKLINLMKGVERQPQPKLKEVEI